MSCSRTEVGRYSISCFRDRLSASAPTVRHSRHISVQALTGVRACRFSKEGFLDAAKSNPALALRLVAIASQS